MQVVRLCDPSVHRGHELAHTRQVGQLQVRTLEISLWSSETAQSVLLLDVRPNLPYVRRKNRELED